MCVPIHCGTTKKLEEHFQNTSNGCGTFAGSWLMFESLSRLFQGMEKGRGRGTTVVSILRSILQRRNGRKKAWFLDLFLLPHTNISFGPFFLRRKKRGRESKLTMEHSARDPARSARETSACVSFLPCLVRHRSPRPTAIRASIRRSSDRARHLRPRSNTGPVGTTNLCEE